MKFSDLQFQKIKFSKKQLVDFFNNAENDLKNAKKTDIPEVVFMLCYNSVVKLGIYIIAKKGYKVRSIPGHHYQILKSLGKITGLKSEIDFLQKVRQKRNIDMYEGGTIISKKESNDLLKITKTIFKKSKRIIH